MKPAAAIAMVSGAGYLFGSISALATASIWTGHYLSDYFNSEPDQPKTILPRPKVHRLPRETTIFSKTEAIRKHSSWAVDPRLDTATDGKVASSKNLTYSSRRSYEASAASGSLSVLKKAVVATQNQYDERFKNLGNSACGAIATLGARKLLEGTLRTARDVDVAVKEGIELYENAPAILLERFGMELEHDDRQFSLDYCLAGSDLGSALNVDLRGGIPVGHQVVLQKNNELKNYRDLLRPLQDRAMARGEPVAAVVTLTPETFAIQFDPRTGQWVYFNSHGNDLMYGEKAVLVPFSSLDELARYFAVKKSYVDLSEARNKSLNHCVLYPVTLRNSAALQSMERDFVGVEGLKAEQSRQLKEFERWAATGDFAAFSRNHFDWWMFPIDRTSRGQGGKYTVYADQIASLKSKHAFMDKYRRGVELLMQSWGWDAKHFREMRNGQKFDGHLVRLGKVLQSLELFDEKELLTSVKAFARKHVDLAKLTGDLAYLRSLIY